MPKKNYKKASLSTTWENNLQQQSIRQFKVLTDDQATCQLLSTTLQTNPNLFTSSIALQYSLSASSVATRILSVKTDHFTNSELMAQLKTMDVQTPQRYMTSDDANRLTVEVMDNVVASQIVDGDYVPDTDMLTLKDIITSSLQLVNVDVGNFTNKMWESVFWDPIYARPDKVTSYLNKILNINQGNHTISKSNSYSTKSDGGIDFGIGGLKFGGKSGSGSSTTTNFTEMNAWLLQHNYDVEIQGEFFIPKTRSLKQLNLGVLNRQEVIYTKNVQINHVDAPGSLTVTVGSESIVESEDIKRLRENTNAVVARLNQLEPRVGQLEPRTTQLEGKINQLVPQLANAVAQENQLSAQIENVRVSLTNALNMKLFACQLCVKPGPNPNTPNGGEMCTPWTTGAGVAGGYVGGHYCTGDGCSYTIRCHPS